MSLGAARCRGPIRTAGRMGKKQEATGRDRKQKRKGKIRRRKRKEKKGKMNYLFFRNYKVEINL
jgi:hypothetical protein